jgi:uroporphyrinogen decarboxylase
MPEYMAIRKHHSLLDICRTPDIAAEVTITAAERLGVDAAIIFADLLLPFTPMGVDFEFINGEGPVVHHPIRTLEQIQALRTDRTADLLYVSHAIEKVARHFATPRSPERPGADPDTLGIIGFCGAPFTLASYMIEGGSSRNYIETKRLMYASGLPTPTEEDRYPERSFAASSRGAVEGPRASVTCHNLSDPSPTDVPSATPTAAWPLLMSKLVEVLVTYATQQVEAGADVIQVFDSWAGALSVSDYRQYCLAPTTELIQRIRALGVPVIYFGVDTASLLSTFRETGADVLGLDWRILLDEARRTLGPGVAMQGNLDPITLFAPEQVLEARVAEILALNANRPGHIFNLGHGIVPNTPVEAVLQVVRQIKNSSRR